MNISNVTNKQVEWATVKEWIEDNWPPNGVASSDDLDEMAIGIAGEIDKIIEKKTAQTKKECIPLVREFRGTARLIQNCLKAGNLKLLVENIEYQLEKVTEFEKQLSGEE